MAGMLYYVKRGRLPEAINRGMLLRSDSSINRISPITSRDGKGREILPGCFQSLGNSIGTDTMYILGMCKFSHNLLSYIVFFRNISNYFILIPTTCTSICNVRIICLFI